MAAGLRRVVSHPLLIAGLWLVGLLFALPAAVVVGEAIHASIDHGTVERGLRDGFDMGWYGEFREGARGLAASFTPTVTGAGTFLDNLEAWLDGTMFLRSPVLVALGLGYLLVWALLLGGVLERYAHPGERHTTARLFRAGGCFLFRFLRLAALSGVLYLLVYRFHRWGYERLEELTRDVTSERTVLLWSLGVTVATALLLALVHLVFAYAKIAVVVDNRRSALLAALRGATFVVRFPARTAGLYAAIAAIGASVAALHTLLAPGAGQSSPGTLAIAVAAGQAALVARLITRLWLWAAQTALYRTLAAAPAMPARVPAAGALDAAPPVR